MGSPEQALAFFRRKSQSLATEDLLAALPHCHRDRRPGYRAGPRGPRRRPRRWIEGSAPAGERTVPPRPTEPRRRPAASGREALRRRRPTLLRAKALEAAAEEFVGRGDRTQARAAFTQAVEVYSSLGAAADVARLQAAFRAHGIRRGPRASTGRRGVAGTASHRPRRRSPRSWRRIVQSGDRGEADAVPADRRDHVSHILKKLDVHSRTHIADTALRSIAPR